MYSRFVRRELDRRLSERRVAIEASMQCLICERLILSDQAREPGVSDGEAHTRCVDALLSGVPPLVDSLARIREQQS